MDAQPHVESDCTGITCGDSKGTAGKMEPKPGDLHVLNSGEGLSGEAGIPMATVPDGMIEVQATGSADDCDHKAAVFTTLEVTQQGQVPDCDPTVDDGAGEPHFLDVRESLSGETGVPVAAVQEVQGIGSGDNSDYNTAAYTLLELSQQGKEPHLHPTAYQQVGFPFLEAAGGPDPSAGSAACTSQYIHLPGGALGQAVAGSCVAAAVSSPVRVKKTDSGASLSHRQKIRNEHNAKERMRRIRLKNALDDLREIVPGVSEATDAASLCELTVEHTRQRNKALVAKYGNETATKIGQEFIDMFQPS